MYFLLHPKGTALHLYCLQMREICNVIFFLRPESATSPLPTNVRAIPRQADASRPERTVIERTIPKQHQTV